MLSGMKGSTSADMAIDLGTANTLVFIPGRGIVLDEPSVVAISTKGGNRDVLAFGEEAKNMLGRTPGDIKVIQPMRDGVIADFVAAEEMIKHVIRRVYKKRSMSAPRIMIGVPADATPVERRAVQEAALAAGARKVYLIEEPVAAALGAGLPVNEPRGSMIVDIGGGTTDIAAFSMGSVILSRSIRTAGNAMDDAIISYVRHKHNLLIGHASAEAIKQEAGTAVARANGAQVNIHIKGRDLSRGVPTEITLGPPDIADALAVALRQLADGIQLAVAEIPPEIAADIAEDGVHLTGGGALLSQLDERLGDLTGIRFAIPEDPMRCVIKGTGIALDRLEEVQELLATI